MDIFISWAPVGLNKNRQAGQYKYNWKKKFK